MSFKQFYLICLLGVTFFAGFYLLFLLFENKKKNSEHGVKLVNQGLLFIILGIFSWSLVALYKLFDVKDLSLSYIINDRILSSLNNLFLILSIAFFPLKKKFFLSKFFVRKEQWVINVFIVFAIIIAVFTITDKMGDNFGLITRFIIVGFDSFVSILGLILMGYVFYYSYKELIDSKFILNYILVVVFGLGLTQVFLPLTKLIPDKLSLYYPFSLAFFIVFLFQFLFIITTYFTLYFKGLNYNFQNIQIEDDVKDQSIDTINQIVLGFDSNEKKYFLKLVFTVNDEEKKELVNYNSKLLQPYLYWLMFSVAKKNNKTIFHSDLAISKFRMVEYWNKESSYKLSQDILFYNDNGNFELILEKENIFVNDVSLFKSKNAVREIFKKHLLCFVDKDVYKSEQLTNRKKAEKYIDENFESIYQTIL